MSLMITCAIKAEAKPLIDHFQLETNDNVFYTNGDLSLIITGTRLIKTAMAMGKYGKKGTKWLNVGIAGHPTHNIGTACMASCVSFAEEVFYPKFTFTPPCTLAPVKTVLTPELSYPEEALYEMEAYAFYKAALAYTSAEAIHLFKVVSDNKERSIFTLKQRDVSSLIEMNLSTLLLIIAELEAIPTPLPDIDTSSYESTWHFTTSEKNQLKDLLQRARPFALKEKLAHLKTAKEVLEKIRDELDKWEMPLEN